MIVETTAECFKINPDVIFSKNRVRDIADARQVIMYLAHKHLALSLTAIGSKLNRLHSTVLHGIKAVEDRIPMERSLAEAVEWIETELKK
jgi:chromosomal replication initiator protein